MTAIEAAARVVVMEWDKDQPECRYQLVRAVNRLQAVIAAPPVAPDAPSTPYPNGCKTGPASEEEPCILDWDSEYDTYGAVDGTEAWRCWICWCAWKPKEPLAAKEPKR